MTLEEAFEKLSLDDKKETEYRGGRILIGFADTEGVPHKDQDKNLWNISIIFKYIVDKNFRDFETIFHTCHFASQKNIGKDAQKPLQTYFDNINMLKDHYSIDDVYLCFWNAPHDASVLRACGIIDLQYIDLLQWARNQIKAESYSIKNLFEKFKGKQELNSLHTGLGDTVRMMKICDFIKKEKDMTENDMLKSFFKHVYKKTPQNKVQKKLTPTPRTATLKKIHSVKKALTKLPK